MRLHRENSKSEDGMSLGCKQRTKGKRRFRVRETAMSSYDGTLSTTESGRRGERSKHGRKPEIRHDANLSLAQDHRVHVRHVGWTGGLSGRAGDWSTNWNLSKEVEGLEDKRADTSPLLSELEYPNTFTVADYVYFTNYVPDRVCHLWVIYNW